MGLYIDMLGLEKLIWLCLLRVCSVISTAASSVYWGRMVFILANGGHLDRPSFWLAIR